MAIPVRIVKQDFDVFDPFIQDDYPDTVEGKITQCTLVLDDGVNDDIEITGTYVDYDVEKYSKTLAESRSYENAINIAQGYGYVLQ